MEYVNLRLTVQLLDQRHKIIPLVREMIIVSHAVYLTCSKDSVGEILCKQCLESS
jgi:hypothetical protein